jgi:hypothetical protein
VSETDSFIQEVTEEVRHDRMFRLWKKYAPYGIAAVAAAVAASGGWTWMKHREAEKARAAGAAFLSTELDSVEKERELVAMIQGPAAVVARLRLAGVMAEQGDTEGAAALYSEIGAEPGLDPAYRDLARLQAVRVSAASIDPAQAVEELEPLLAEGAPYRLLALELRAVIRINAGETEAGHADLAAILQDPGATPGLRDRATALLLSSGGEVPVTATLVQ